MDATSDYFYFMVHLLIGCIIFFLFGTCNLTAISSALRQLFKSDFKRSPNGLSKFYYRKIHLYFFPDKEFEGLYFATTCALNIFRFCLAGSFFILLAWSEMLPKEGKHISWFTPLLLSFAFVIFAFFTSDFIPRILGTRYPSQAINICGPIASILMLLAFPIIYIFLKAFMGISKKLYFEDIHAVEAQVKQEIINIIQEARVTSGLDAHEKKLIESVVTFRDRVAREVMVPRVDLFSLPAETTICDAANLLQAEGYSRIPVYKNNIDNIIGVLMYKDILTKFMEYEQNKNDPKILEAPIEGILKGVLYTPETKKISHLLQEFRKRQMHLAIVVDEYGGTEGIVTIEDILEEIVGEIADEYDKDEALFVPLPEGGWRVDARMSILDVEELLDIKIPQEGEYDTIGGYIFHRTGSIPSKGVVIHHDTFDLEILSSNDRSVDEVRITPIKR